MRAKGTTNLHVGIPGVLRDPIERDLPPLRFQFGSPPGEVAVISGSALRWDVVERPLVPHRRWA
jgi:hypothetical protein